MEKLVALLMYVGVAAPTCCYCNRGGLKGIHFQVDVAGGTV